MKYNQQTKEIRLQKQTINNTRTQTSGTKIYQYPLVHKNKRLEIKKQ